MQLFISETYVTPADILLDDRNLSRDRHMHQSAAAAAADSLIVMVVVMNIVMGCVAVVIL